LKKPLLILGYERSGTTLLRRIVSMHPSLEYDIVHEQKEKLFRSKTKKDAIHNLTMKSKQNGVFTGGISSIVSGQKIPYLDLETAKKAIDKFSYFFNEFWIIHIIRNKEDAINSQIRTFKRKKHFCVQRYDSSVPGVIGLLQERDNVLTVKFEDILDSPLDFTKYLYEWIGDFKENDSFVNKVISTKDLWIYNGRVMCGLRYFNSIKRKNNR
jgi:hypothetical protein